MSEDSTADRAERTVAQQATHDDRTDDDIPTYPPVVRSRTDWWTRGAVVVLLVAVLLDFTGRLAGHNSTQHQIRELVCSVTRVEPDTAAPAIAHLRQMYNCAAFVPNTTQP